ncbi:MAG: TIGR03546 family protein, partial [Gammaproteobacteria bacterium]|nr:TIGR03546 family protein [Gammaproteobacteria bacterium]
SSETSPMQISAAFALSMIAGLTPLISLHNIIVIFLLLIFRINLAAFILGLTFFTGMAYLLDPTFHKIGYSILSNQDLNGLWTELYNITIWRISGFNNTITMGSLFISLLAFLPVLILTHVLIKRYRTHILIHLDNSRIFRLLKSSKILTRLISMSE